MKHLVFNIHDKKSFKKAIKESSKKIYNSKLLQVFTSLSQKKDIITLIETLSKKFDKTTIIGTTTAGEIENAKMLEKSTIISLSLFEKTTIKAVYVKNIDEESGIKLSSKLCSKDTKASIILSEGLNGKDYGGFLNGFNQKNPDVIVSGGLAGDDFRLKKTFIFLNNKVYSEGSVGVSFSGKSLYVDNRYNLNWTPIGKEFVVTKSQGNKIYEIDNQNSIDFFKKYLGSGVFKDNAKALPDFQLLFSEGSTVVARTPMAREKDALVFAAPIKEGQKVQFGFSNAASVISGSARIGKSIEKKPAEAIYIYSCIARKGLLGRVLENEFLNFKSVANSAGFFTYGEYYSTGENNAVLNCTTTLLIMSESRKIDKKQKRKNNKFSSSLEDITFNALTHFIQQTSDELNSNVQLLNQYKAVVDTALLVSKTDKQGNITYVNDNFCHTSQYTQEELLGQNHNIVRGKETSPFIFKKMWNTIQQGKVWKGQFPNRAKDGSIYYVHATVMPIYAENNIDGYIAIRQNITKQILAKNKTKEKEKFIKAIFDNQDNIVILSSISKGILSVNKTLFEYFDYANLDDLKSKHDCICELFMYKEGYIHPDKDSDWLDTIINNPEVDHKVKMLTKDNTIHIFNVRINKIDQEYIINLSDITNLENALNKAYSSEQAKTIFLANMSHEIRTPLNGILGFTDILRKKSLDESSKKYVDIIHKSGKSLLNVVNDILDYSKIESGELSLFISESNLFSEMESAVSTFSSSARTKNIDYIAHVDTRIPKIVSCDIQRIKQVMSNLLSNAIKFTPEKGRVNVDIELKSVVNNIAIIKFSVIDSGIGISQEKIQGMFKPFSQADNSISRKFGGTGLGLSISSRYVEMMDSKLSVLSKKDDGSEFHFILQLPIVEKEKSLEELNYHKNITIMKNDYIAENDISQITSIYLNSWSYDYKEIESFKEINESTDILIVSAQYFSREHFINALKDYVNLHIVCLETGQGPCVFEHERFHSIEQPMVGSSLFNLLNSLLTQDIEILTCSIEEEKKFNGNVLVAEDNETNQMLISIMLEERGLDYRVVSNGQEAVDEAQRNDYDLIFMDINMPVLDGLSAIKILRSRDYVKPIVSLSANVIELDVKKYLEAGVNTTINKPIVASELDDILGEYIKNKNNEDATHYDTIDLDALSKSLSLLNKDTVIKLLFSFKDFLNEMILLIQSNALDKKTLHSIKGTAGNLRFNVIYRLVKGFEKDIDTWDEEKSMKNQETLLVHLLNAVDEIDRLNN